MTVVAALALTGSLAFAAEPEPLKIDEEYGKRRAAMVSEQLAEEIRDKRVLRAMGAVSREIFVRPGLRFRAYQDGELPVEKGQFLSRPQEWARGLELLELPEEARVLVMDPGVGYGGALVSQAAEESWVVVTIPDLLFFVQTRYEQLGYANLAVKAGPVAGGWAQRGPFDRIFIPGVISGAVPSSLLDQLKPGGVLLVVEGKEYQNWVRYARSDEGEGVTRTVLDRCHFPPLESSE